MEVPGGGGGESSFGFNRLFKLYSRCLILQSCITVEDVKLCLSFLYVVLALSELSLA